MRHQSQIRGVLWDLDGVIADTQSFHFVAMRQALNAFGRPTSEEIVQRLFGTTTEKIILTIFEGNIEWDLVEEIKKTHSRFFCENINGKVVAFPGVVDCLRFFSGRGVRQAIASSSTIEIIGHIVDELNIRRYFQALVSGADLPSKPDAAIFRRAAEAVGLANDECLVIEDSPMGIESAHAAGMRCLAVATSRPAEALSAAEIRVERLSDIDETIFEQLEVI